MAKRMKVDRRIDFGPPACLGYRTYLVTFAPRRAVGLEQHRLVARTLRANIFEEGCAVNSQNDMARLPGLAEPYGDGAGIPVKVIHAQPNEFAIASARLQCGANEISKSRVTSIQKTLALTDGEIAYPSSINSFERRNLTPFLI